MKTITSERNIESNFFKIKIGTLDKKNPSTMYVDAGTYITPNREKDSYKSDILSIEKKMKQLTGELLSSKTFIQDNFMFVTDVAINRISPERGTHFTIQVYFKPSKNDIALKKNFGQLCKEYIKQYRDSLPLYQKIIESHGFSCSKTKGI